MWWHWVTTVTNTRTNHNGARALTSLTGFMQWQLQHFGSTTNPAAAPDFDASGTGQDNQFKFAAGLDPTNPASVFELYVDLRSNQPSLVFGPVWSDRVYHVEATTSLGANDWSALTPDTSPTSNTSQLSIPDPMAATSRFYRVGITIP